jgi:hypothetical protein
MGDSIAQLEAPGGPNSEITPSTSISSSGWGAWVGIDPGKRL